MTTDITVRKETEAIFKEACNELSITHEVFVNDNPDYENVYRLHCDPNDLYYLGRMIGLKIGQQIAFGNL